MTLGNGVSANSYSGDRDGKEREDMKSSFSSWPQHENFEELAALAAVGELSALELERLRHHLVECSRCRDAYQAFADVASNDLGVAVAAANPWNSWPSRCRREASAGTS